MPAGDFINKSLKEGFERFNAFVAFVSTGGINNIKDSLLEFIGNGGLVHLYVGVDMHGTSKEALQLLIDLDIPTSIVYSSNRIVYHPKIYSFESESCLKLLIGSSNLTISGLYQNVEASIALYGKNDDSDDIRNIASDIYENFNLILKSNSTICKPLSQNLLELLVENGLVISEKDNILITNEVSKKHYQTPAYSKRKLSETFSKLNIAKSPIYSRKTLKSETYINTSGDNPQVVQQIIEIKTNTMWICSGKLTGGSRNILDLSKKGKRDRNIKPGSVTFFGVDPNQTNFRNDNITIVYNGKKFFKNSLIYTHGNSNWRIQLKGVAEDGDKLTNITKPYFGQDAGLYDKILLFHKLEELDTYELTSVSMEDLSTLQDASNDWAIGGNSTNGRMYGFI